MQNLLSSHSNRCEALSNKTDGTLNALQNMMMAVLKQNLEIKESITFISQQYEDIRMKVDLLESEKRVDRTYIHQLEDRVDSLERMLYTQKLEIKNIPLTSNEKQEDLCTIVLNTANAVAVSLQRTDIKEVSCMNRNDSSSKIIVDLACATIKNNVIKKTRQFNATNKQNKLNTSHLMMDGPPTPTYVSECLPPRTQHIFYRARKFAKENGYMYCWTTSGRIYLRKNAQEKQIIIRSETDLESLVSKI